LTNRERASRFSQFGRLLLPSQLLIIGVISLWIVVSGLNVLNLPLLQHLNQVNKPYVIRLGILQWLHKLFSDLTMLSSLLDLYRVILRPLGYLSSDVSQTLSKTHIVVATMTHALGLPLCIFYGSRHRRYSSRQSGSFVVTQIVLIPIWGFSLKVYNLEAGYDFQYGQVCFL
jgi:hypothetical protein